MAISVTCLTSSFTSLSFSSQKPYAISLTHSKKFSLSASIAQELETREDLLNLVKSRLPGGFAAQPLHGTGRRKSASARVVLQEGSGKIIINYRNGNEYLQGNPLWIQYVKTPLATLGYEASYDIFVKVEGGGLSGQAQAISLGIARALLKLVSRRLASAHNFPSVEVGTYSLWRYLVERFGALLTQIGGRAYQ
ncbi:hypothetical protein K7X08_014558 [Anisodus acutangulus]|uniref:Ribosomal protein S9 n=1 Tax=Anisodus acutangulus TaxID=402998 RepID=A0A9Q1LMD1_9SOLA|nr:hypothetical protein K7X08_014558 [Anisodus acutangulus]